MAINKSRGRPATGREHDGTLFLRLPSGRKEEVKKLVREFLGQAAPVDSSHSKPKDVPTPTPEGDNASKGLESSVTTLVATDAKQTAALLDDIQRLTDEKASLEMGLEEARNSDLDEKGNYWKLKYLELEAKVKQQGEFSQ